MTDPRTHDELTQFDLVTHAERYAGLCTGAEPPEVGGGNRGYAIAFYRDDETGMVTAVSNGLRFQPPLAAQPMELACTVLLDQQEAARYLVDTVAGMIMSRGEPLTWGTPLDNGTVLLTGTQITGLLAGPHPFFDDAFDTVTGTQGGELRLVSLIPVTAAELQAFGAIGPEPLWAQWQAEDTELYDVTRASAF